MFLSDITSVWARGFEKGTWRPGWLLVLLNISCQWTCKQICSCWKKMTVYNIVSSPYPSLTIIMNKKENSQINKDQIKIQVYVCRIIWKINTFKIFWILSVKEEHSNCYQRKFVRLFYFGNKPHFEKSPPNDSKNAWFESGQNWPPKITWFKVSLYLWQTWQILLTWYCCEHCFVVARGRTEVIERGWVVITSEGKTIILKSKSKS